MNVGIYRELRNGIALISRKKSTHQREISSLTSNIRSTFWERCKLPKQSRFVLYSSLWGIPFYDRRSLGRGRGRDILYKHVPASFSVHSNIPGHTAPEHIQSSRNPQKLIDELVSILLLQQESASRIMHEKFSDIFTRLDDSIQYSKKKVEPLLGKDRLQDTYNEPAYEFTI